MKAVISHAVEMFKKVTKGDVLTPLLAHDFSKEEIMEFYKRYAIEKGEETRGRR